MKSKNNFNFLYFLLISPRYSGRIIELWVEYFQVYISKSSSSLMTPTHNLHKNKLKVLDKAYIANIMYDNKIWKNHNIYNNIIGFLMYLL